MESVRESHKTALSQETTWIFGVWRRKQGSDLSAAKEVELHLKIEFSLSGTLYFSSLIMTFRVYAKHHKAPRQIYPVVILLYSRVSASLLCLHSQKILMKYVGDWSVRMNVLS